MLTRDMAGPDPNTDNGRLRYIDSETGQVYDLALGVDGATRSLKDPNSIVWQPNHRGDPRTNPDALAWNIANFHGLDAAQTQQALSLAGNVNPAFSGAVVNQANQGFPESKHDTSFGQDLVDFATPPAIMAGVAAGFNALPALAGTAGASAGGSAAAGGSMMPAAIPESAATLSGWGLTETAPGVWSAAGGGAGGAAGAALASGGATSGTAMPPAVPESPTTLSEWGLTETSPGVWSNVGNAAAFGGLGAAVDGGLAKAGLLGTGLALGDLARGIPGAIGALAAHDQASKLDALARDYMAMGAPSRGRYEASFAPGFTMAADPGYTDALNQTTKATLHGLSVGGNPADSPNAWAKTLEDLNAKFAFPALQNYRSTNASAGGLSALTGAAPAASTGAINAGANVWNSLGAGAADIFSPPKSINLEQLLKKMGL
jgi:hypothetical protein